MNIINEELDGLVTSYTALGYPNVNPKENEIFRNIIHVTYITNAKNFSLIWPAMLLENDFPLPNEIIIHNSWLLKNNKTVRSYKNGMLLDDILYKYGINPVRFYMLKEGPFNDNKIYQDENIPNIFNDNIIKKFSNTLNRIINNKLFNESMADLNIQTEPNTLTKNFINLFNNKANLVYNTTINPNASIDKIIDLLITINKYINESHFWENNDKTMILTIYESIKIICILLYPIIPEYQEKASLFFGINKMYFNFLHFINLSFIRNGRHHHITVFFAANFFSFYLFLSSRNFLYILHELNAKAIKVHPFFIFSNVAKNRTKVRI